MNFQVNNDAEVAELSERKRKRQIPDPFDKTRETIEEVRKQLEANTFQSWLPVVSPSLTWDWKHQLYLYAQLDRVTSGEVNRLQIAMPPRHTKSETVTVRYAAWRLEQNPSLRIVIAAYTQRLANKFSRKIRRILRGRIEFSTECNAVEEWETAAGGGIRAVGVGGGITGFGADLIIIDDPVKSRKQANSETYRENTWEWFCDDIYTRLEPGGQIILIQTRWHSDDLAGRLQKEMLDEDGEHWEIVSLPALAEENDPLGRAIGEALCPDRYDEEALAKRRKKLGEYSFAALFQQRPVPRNGGLFKYDWFPLTGEKSVIKDKAPDGLRWCRGYDLAVSQRTSADNTASFRCAFDKAGNLWIEGGFCKKIEYPEQKRYVVSRMKSEARTEHGIEKALHGIALVQDLRRVQSIRGVAFKAVPVDSDKYTRALPWADLAEEGKVFFVRDTPGNRWIRELIEELIVFTGKGETHDDRVDAISVAVQMLSKRSSKGYGF